MGLICSSQHLVYSTSWGRGGSCTLPLCAQICHFSAHTTVFEDHANAQQAETFCTCIPFHPVGQLLSLCVSKTDILYERFMRLRCKRHTTASPGKQKLHLLAKSPVRRFARARLEILPVKTVKRGEARQLELATFSCEKVIECPNAKKKKNTPLFSKID